MANGAKFPPGLLRTPWIDPQTGNINLAWQKWIQNMGSSNGSTGVPNFSDGEIPMGAVNGTNATFTLENAPNPTTSLALYKNGQKLRQGIGYLLNGNVITYRPGYIPASGDEHEASYRF